MKKARGLQRATFLALAAVLFFGQGVFPTPFAYALAVPTTDMPNTAVNTATKITTAKSLIEHTLQTAKSFAMHFKEFVGDSLANIVAKTVLRTITQSTVNWINSGFKGSPSFVTNPEGFLADITDQVIGQTIEELVPFVCSPFRLDLRIALGLNFSFNTQREIHCRLSDVIANVEGAYGAFVGGDFGAGGWSSWISIAGTPQNNPYGAYLSTVSQINARLINAAGQEIKLLDWGKGFMSWRECEVPGEPIISRNLNGSPRTRSVPTSQAEREIQIAEGATVTQYKDEPIMRPGPCRKNGPIKTPGSVIESSLSTALGADLNALGVADEINEVFAALLNQLIKQVFMSTGLAGATDGSGRINLAPVPVSQEQARAFSASTTQMQKEAEEAAATGADSIAGGIYQNINTATAFAGAQLSSDSFSSFYTPAPRTGNLALGKYAEQSSYRADDYQPPSAAVDGTESGYSFTVTDGLENESWWQVDLSRNQNRTSSYTIHEITDAEIIINEPRYDGGTIYFFISPNPFNPSDSIKDILTKKDGVYKFGPVPASVGRIGIQNITEGTVGPYVRVQREGAGYLTLGEVRVFGSETTDLPAGTAGAPGAGTVITSLALNKKASQSTTADGKGAELAADGTINSLAETESEPYPWWQIDLSEESQTGARSQIGQVTRVDVYTKAPPAGARDYAVFADPLTDPAGVLDTAFSRQNLAEDICGQKPVPKIRSYPLSYGAGDSSGVATGVAVPAIAERTWNVRVQRCNLSGAPAPLSLYEVTVSGTESALASGKTPVPPKAPLAITLTTREGVADVTDGEKELNNPQDMAAGQSLLITANETRNGMRFATKLQAAVGGGALFEDTLWSNYFQGFVVSSQTKIRIGNAANWVPRPTVEFIRNLAGSCRTDANGNIIERCMNTPVLTPTDTALPKLTPDANNPRYPITFLSGVNLNKNDQVQVTFTGTTTPGIANGRYRIVLQAFQGDGVIPIASTAIRFTKD